MQPKTEVRRLPQRAVHDRAALHAILDEGLVAPEQDPQQANAPAPAHASRWRPERRA